MNKLMICVIVAVVGCTTTNQSKVSTAMVKESQKRMEKVESNAGDVKSVPVNQDIQRENTIEANIDMFVKEHLNVKFGESVVNKELITSGTARKGMIPVKNKYKYFNKAEGLYLDGILFGVNFYSEIPTKYSKNSTKTRIDSCVDELGTLLGCNGELFKQAHIFTSPPGDPLPNQYFPKNKKSSYYMYEIHV